ncbi:MAG: DUF432 domain-containing protein [Ignisphaera sp.]|nr:DUF432 domain-containing protein [Ignisphaera sp.]MDW8084855.1 DUF432 domain-containing protein [Ignisphaera sp.]
MFGMEISEPLVLGMHRIDVTRVGEGILYKRYRNGVIEREILAKNVTLKLMPIYPIFYPRFITRYILCEFSTPIYVPPMESIALYMHLPIDIAVYGYKNGSFTIIDVVPMHRLYKYTLYGPPSKYGDVGGVVARYCRTSTSLEKPTDVEVGFCLSQIEIKSRLEKFTVVSKLLLDSSPLAIFYKLGSWRCCTQHIMMMISSTSAAVVEYGGQPIESGFKALDEPEEAKAPLISSRSEMMWGY